MLHADDVPLSFRCDASWEDMDGTRQTRLCSRCDRNVHDLTEMNLTALQRLLLSPGQTCVRYRVNPETGNLVTPAASAEAAALALGANVHLFMRPSPQTRTYELSHLAAAMRRAYGSDK